MFQSLIRKELYEDDYLFNEQEYKGKRKTDWKYTLIKLQKLNKKIRFNFEFHGKNISYTVDDR